MTGGIAGTLLEGVKLGIFGVGAYTVEVNV
jgi:hypothetical protein